MEMPLTNDADQWISNLDYPYQFAYWQYRLFDGFFGPGPTLTPCLYRLDSDSLARTALTAAAAAGGTVFGSKAHPKS